MTTVVLIGKSQNPLLVSVSVQTCCQLWRKLPSVSKNGLSVCKMQIRKWPRVILERYGGLKIRREDLVGLIHCLLSESTWQILFYSIFLVEKSRKQDHPRILPYFHKARRCSSPESGGTGVKKNVRGKSSGPPPFCLSLGPQCSSTPGTNAAPS